jgi:NADH dehydrogenase
MNSTALIIGGGLAGVACAQGLAAEGVEVTLVDRNDYLQFQPLLYQVASSQLPARDIARPLSRVFADQPGVSIVLARVTKVDLGERSVMTDHGQTLSADHLVLAVGSQPNFFGVPGAAEHAFPMYSVADAERLRLHLQMVLVEAADAQDTEPVDIVVVGGGPTGVETSGAIAEIIGVLSDEGQLARAARIHLVDRGDALLPQFSEKAQEYALDKLTGYGVDVRLGTGVARVGAESAELDDGTTIATTTVVWAGGSSGAEVVQGTGKSSGRGGRIDVAPDLTVDGFPGVHAIGDAANIPGHDGGTLPQLGSVAQQSGRHAADNILLQLSGDDPKTFRYKDKGIMAMIGRNAAVAEVGKHRHQVDGPVAFAAWLGVHAMLLSGVHSKSDAFLSWAWDY